jgi:hypothetical protein
MKLSDIMNLYIGNPNCKHNALSPILRCAVNPSGPCEGCLFFERKALNFRLSIPNNLYCEKAYLLAKYILSRLIKVLKEVALYFLLLVASKFCLGQTSFTKLEIIELIQISANIVLLFSGSVALFRIMKIMNETYLSEFVERFFYEMHDICWIVCFVVALAQIKV